MAMPPITSKEYGLEPLSAADLEEICALIYKRSGMVFGETKRYYIERRITDLLRQRRARSVRDYISILRSDFGESELLINSFTINETYFYRELHQLSCLSNSILPDLIRAKGPGDRIRIWSMPCSSGEEPYSIAIWLLEHWPLVDAYNVEIVGSDIDTAALDLIPIGAEFDIGSQLFPMMVALGLPFYAQTRKFNWVDIGTVSDYWAVMQSIMTGEVEAEISRPGWGSRSTRSASAWVSTHCARTGGTASASKARGVNGTPSRPACARASSLAGSNTYSTRRRSIACITRAIQNTSIATTPACSCSGTNCSARSSRKTQVCPAISASSGRSTATTR